MAQDSFAVKATHTIIRDGIYWDTGIMGWRDGT